MRTRDDYNRELGVGLAYEDFVLERLWENGWGTVAFRTASSQGRGENLGGFEIKRDGEFRNTGNLFIETEERSTSSSEWHPAGVDSPAKPRHLVIGDEESFWVLSVNALQMIRESCRHTTNRTDTARGFLLKCDRADRFCCFRWGV